MAERDGEGFDVFELFEGGKWAVLSEMGRRVYEGLMCKSMSSEVAAWHAGNALKREIDEDDVRRLRKGYVGGLGEKAYETLMRLGGKTMDECVPVNLLKSGARERIKELYGLEEKEELADLDCAIFLWDREIRGII